MNDMEAKTVAETLVEGFFSRMGVPMIIHSIKGAVLSLGCFWQICALLGIKNRKTAFNPCSNGLVERYNGTLNEMLCATTGEHPTTWDQRIPLLMLAYRGTQHELTGFSPHFMVYDRDFFMPI